MNKNRDDLIAGLTDELAPVRSFSQRDGMQMLAIAAGVTLAGVMLIEGLWYGAFQGEAAPFFWVTNGLLLLLGLASSGAVIAMASPGVGNRHDAPKWSFAMLGVLPLAAFMSILSHGTDMAAHNDPYALHCFTASLVASLGVGGALTMWLRRGAPVSQEAAGWFTGIGAGALGTLLYGLSCPADSITHLGIWHVVPVAVAAIAGRLIVPKLIAW
ncbi:hypothetical protein BPTFM16_01710 [Altererythrobacter insulae]|nr:hypothetical protein BPTFM16_01710 [Altererythrobacter insulae]